MSELYLHPVAKTRYHIVYEVYDDIPSAMNYTSIARSSDEIIEEAVKAPMIEIITKHIKRALYDNC
jgi:hypothetical protein